MDQYPDQHAGAAIMNVVDATIENRWFSRLLLFVEFSDLSLVDLFPVTHEVSMGLDWLNDDLISGNERCVDL